MSVSTYTKAGAKAATPAKLNKDIFNIEVKSHELLKQAYVAYLSNGRSASANVKTRGLVSGGGKKPWKQKGTGRARFGSSRNPIWRGGGIVFGPTGEENYIKKLPTTAKRKAIKQALSLANASKQLSVIESFEVKDGKTSSAAKLLAKVSASKNILIVVESKDEQTMQAISNLQNTTLVAAKYLNVYNVLNADSILITKGALGILDEWLISKEAK